MQKHNKDRFINCIIALVPVLIVVIVSGICFDYYYDLNDDVLMKDIISGDYSGMPQGHNIQMLWIMSAVISLLYRMASSIPWYGLILCVFQYLSLWIIIERSLRMFDRAFEKGYKALPFNNFKFPHFQVVIKLLFATALTLLIYSLMLPHFLNIQYTVTVSFLAGATVMMISTGDESKNIKEFFIHNLAAVLLVFAAYLLRSEMLLLMAPFILLSIVINFSYESVLFNKENIKKYISFVILFLILPIVGFVSNKLAYSSVEWKEFCSLFDARTELYDYQVVPLYDGNEAFYESLGMEEAEALLFDNYNFGISNKVDSDTMWKVADYAGSKREEELSFSERLIQKIRLYIYELSHGKNSTGSDYPFNMVAGLLYIMIAGLLIAVKDYIGLLRPIALFAGRSLIWLYILLGDRTPDRITHSLYFIEIIVLLGILVHIISGEKTGYILNTEKIVKDDSGVKYYGMVTLVIITVFVALIKLIIPDSAYYLKSDQNVRKDINMPYIELYKYTNNHPDNLYLMDVYSSVSYSEKMFGVNSKINKSNTEIAGGWFCFSPGQSLKLSKFESGNDLKQALLSDGVYFISRKDRDIEWLYDYYRDYDIETDAKIVDSIQGVFDVYEIRRQ